MPKETVELDRPIIPVTNAARAVRCLGGLVSVEGKAVDQDRCATVEREDLAVHLLALEKWPEDVLGKTVTVTGELSRTGEDEGSVFALDDPRYEVGNVDSGTEDDD